MQKQKKIIIGIIIIVVVVIIAIGGLFAYENFTTKSEILSAKSGTNYIAISGAHPADNYAEDVGSAKSEKLTLWPDVNSFDMEQRTFEAKGVRDSASIKRIKVRVMDSTEISSKNMSNSINDLQGMYLMMKNWKGPEWWFTVEGIMIDGRFTDNGIMIDGLFGADKIFIQGQ